MIERGVVDVSGCVFDYGLDDVQSSMDLPARESMLDPPFFVGDLVALVELFDRRFHGCAGGARELPAGLAGEATQLRCESLSGRAAHGLDGPLAHSVTRRCCVCVP